MLASSPRASALTPSTGDSIDQFDIQYSIDQAESTKELARSLGLKLSASASWGTGSASGKMSLFRKSQSHQYSGYLVVSARALRRTEVMQDPRFTTEALALLQASPILFYATYGDAFVYRKGWGAELTAVLEVEAKKYETTEEFSAAMKASQGNFSASASVKTTLNEVLKDRNVRVLYSQRGGFHGRDVCLDAFGKTAERCSTWVNAIPAEGSPSRGGVVALTLEELIVRLRDFGKEVWQYPQTAQLFFVDVLDYSAIPRPYGTGAGLYDRVKTERRMEDLGEILATLKDRLETVRFARSHRDTLGPATCKTCPGAPATVVIDDDLYAELPRIESLYLRGLQLVTRCLEDHARLVDEMCLEEARSYYLGTAFIEDQQSYSRPEPIDTCEVFDENKDWKEEMGISAELKTATSKWENDKGESCVDVLHLQDWTTDAAGEPQLSDGKQTASTQPATTLSGEAGKRFLRAITFSPDDVQEMYGDLVKASSIVPQEGETPLAALQRHARSKFCEEAAMELNDLQKKPYPKSFIQCLLGNPITLVPSSYPEACTAMNRSHLQTGKAKVKWGKTKRVRLTFKVPEDKKFEQCDYRVMAEVGGSKEYKAYLAGYEGRRIKVGKLVKRKGQGSEEIIEIAVTNKDPRDKISFYLDYYYGLAKK